MKKKQRGIMLYTDKTFEEKEFPVKEGQIKPSKKEEVRFAPSNVFTELKTWTRLKFWRHPRKIILWVKGTVEAIDFKKDMTGLNPFWTMEEAYDFVYKNMQKALMEHKPMKWSQFIILAILSIIIIVLLFYNLQSGRKY